jgi:hypothetical protein
MLVAARAHGDGTKTRRHEDTTQGFEKQETRKSVVFLASLGLSVFVCNAVGAFGGQGLSSEEFEHLPPRECRRQPAPRARTAQPDYRPMTFSSAIDQ